MTEGPSQSVQRTLLAGDRTMLAWLRTAFGAYAVAIGIGGVLPKISDSGSVVYRLVGGALALIGVLGVALGLGQYVVMLRASEPLRLAQLGVRLTLGFGIMIALLGVAIMILIAVAP
jgi:uncharacterized membrane protein YidH (DUF202 family)